MIWLLLIYLALPLLVLRTRPCRIFSRGEIVPIYLAIVLASPMLFVLERGNLQLLAAVVDAINLAILAVLLWEVYARYFPKEATSAFSSSTDLKSGTVAPRPATLTSN